MNIGIIGNGWIANILAPYFKGQGIDATILPGRIEDITSPLEYDVVINTAAKTAIDWCEMHKQEAFDANVTAAVKLAHLVPGKLVHFSSACVFESSLPTDIKYEDSVANPQCFYAETKLMAERLLTEIKPDILIIRPRLLLSEVPHPRNTIDKLLKYPRVITSQESVTIVEDMLPVIKQLISENASGVFHVVNDGLITPAEIMALYGNPFEPIEKTTLDAEMKKLGRARRTSVTVGSRRIPLMRPIGERIEEVLAKYKAHMQ